MTLPRMVALLPMRHDSERVPGKNHRVFGDRPLYQHMLSTLLAVETIDVVVVDTDSALIAEQVRAGFPDVRLVARPDHLRDGHTPMTEVLAHTTSTVPAEHYLQTHSTNPLLRPATVTAAVERYLRAVTERRADSLFGVTRLQTRLYDADHRPVNHDPALLLRTQDLPPVFEDNSTLYLFGAELVAAGRRIGDRPLLHEVDPLEAVDIDVEADWQIAEALHRTRSETYA